MKMKSDTFIALDYQLNQVKTELEAIRKHIFYKLQNPLASERETLTAYEDKVLTDRKSTRLNSSHIPLSRMPSSA